MKKIYLLIVTLILLFPISTKAVEIKNINILGKEQITIGESFTESILISFDDLEQTYNQSDGLLYLKYELSFDPEIFTIISYESPDWDTIFYQENDKYYVLSIVNNENKLKNNCPTSFLYCGNYQNTIEFFTNNTTTSSTNIAITNLELGLLDIATSRQTPTIEDIMIENPEYSNIHTLAINQTQENVDHTKKEDIIIDITTEEINNKIIAALELEPIISDIPSSLLSDLNIADYQIKFNKHKNNYELEIDENISSLDITVTPEDDNATYTITGNENLNNNSQITIEVTASNNQVNTYKINITVKDSLNDESLLTSTKNSLDIKDLYLKYKKYLLPGVIIIGALLLILLIIKIISKIKDNKIEDMTNKF